MKGYVPTPDVIAAIRAQYRAGVSTQRIADRLGLHRGTVTKQIGDLRQSLARIKHADVSDLGDWHTRAACQGEPVDTFFPEPADRVSINAAIAICRGCPVIDACAAYAERTGSREGVFGGRYLGTHPGRVGAA